MAVLLDQKGKEISLGKRIGAGGEAVAYEMGEDPSLVVKIYHKPVNQTKAKKLLAMVGMAGDKLTPFAAWPKAVVTNSERKQVLGIVLPRVAGMEIHSLYTPANRKRHFPEADWRFLVHVAHNFAAGVQVLHGNGIVMGDINQGNVLVGTDGLVNFIDCDSYQIQSANRIFRCEVGVPHFSPPELLGVSFSSIDRNYNHDGFGLAVMIFHLLFVGRHPFVGRYFGPGEMSIEQAIANGRFAYGKHRSLLKMEPPPHALMMEELTPKIDDLFERAFVAVGSGVSQRPLPSEWCEALNELESSLVECERDHGHWLIRGSSCPWCRIENSGGPKLFESVSQDWHKSRWNDSDDSRILKTIDALPVHLKKFLKQPQISLVDCEAIPSPKATKAGGLQRFLGYAALVSTFASLLGFYWWGFWLAFVPAALVFSAKYFLFGYFAHENSDLRHLKTVIEQSRNEMMELDRRSQVEIAAIEKRAEALKSLAREARIELELLDKAWRWSSGHENRKSPASTLEDDLADVLICEDRILGINSADLILLESFGVEAASDVSKEKLESIPGLTKNLISDLLAWKQTKTSILVENPDRIFSSAFHHRIDVNYLKKKIPIQAEIIAFRHSLEKTLASGRARVDEINAKQQSLLGNLQKANKEILDIRNRYIQ